MSLQRVHSRGQASDERDEFPQQPRSPYLTAREAVDYLRLGSESALYRLVREHGLPNLRRGRLYLFDTREIDAWLRGAGSAIELVRAHKRKSAIAHQGSSMGFKAIQKGPHA